VRGLTKFAAHSLRLIAPSALALGLTATSVSALTINDTYLSSITTSVNAATIEAEIQSASQTIASLYGNPVTVNILFGTNSSVLVQSTIAGYINSYSAYTSLLNSNASANPANTILSTAVANLSHDNSGPVFSTSANLRALGVTTATGFYNSSGNFVSGGGQQYDGVVTLGNLSYAPNGPGLNSQGVDLVEHAINEILGGGGAGSTLGTGNFNVALGGLDLYRYQSTGSTIADVDSTPSYTTSSNAVVAFSVDGGNTAIAQFNQAGGGSDYGDFANVGPCQIQAAFYCGATALYTTSSPEYLMMESIGYDPTSATPLPSTWLMLLSGFVGLGYFAYRGTKKRTAALAAA
jgi:hypothetical protein